MTLNYLEGKRFCVVFAKRLEGGPERVQLQCLRGRASVEGGRVTVMRPDGAGFAVPGSALHRIQPSDGTALLGDAEFYVIVQVDRNIQLGGFDAEAVLPDEPCPEEGAPPHAG